MPRLEAVGARHMAEDRVAVLLGDVLVGPERLAPGEARQRIELLVELVVVLDLVAGERREIAGGDVGDAIVGPSVGIAKMAVGEADLLPERVHLLSERLLGPGD